MSEQGWLAFLSADGVEDWVVLHGGATAVYAVDSLGAAARLAAAGAEVPGLEGAGALLTLSRGQGTVRLPRGGFRGGQAPVGPARAGSPVGPAGGAGPARGP